MTFFLIFSNNQFFYFSKLFTLQTSLLFFLMLQLKFYFYFILATNTCTTIPARSWRSSWPPPASFSWLGRRLSRPSWWTGTRRNTRLRRSPWRGRSRSTTNSTATRWSRLGPISSRISCWSSGWPSGLPVQSVKGR